MVDDTSGLSAGADIDAKSTTEEIPYTIEEVPDQEKRDSLRDQLSNEEYMLFPARIPAFSLRQKKWGHVLVDNLREIEWNDNAFDFLEMDAEKKLLTQGLINGHKNVSASETSTGIVQRFDDIVAGKGRGLIFLLHGPPGLGKTLTAGKH